MYQWRKHRSLTEYPVTLVAENTSHKVRIVDVNEDGVGLRDVPELAEGTHIRLEFMHNRISAKISWQKGNLAGAAFESRIDDRMMDWMRLAAR